MRTAITRRITARYYVCVCVSVCWAITLWNNLEHLGFFKKLDSQGTDTFLIRWCSCSSPSKWRPLERFKAVFSVPSTGLASLQPLSIAKKKIQNKHERSHKKLFLLRTFFRVAAASQGIIRRRLESQSFRLFYRKTFLWPAWQLRLTSDSLSLSLSLSRCSLPLSANFAEKQAEALDQSQGASVRLFCSLDFYILTSISFSSDELLCRLFPHLWLILEWSSN